MLRIENIDEINAFKSLTASLEYRYIHSSSVNDIMNLYVISGYTQPIFKVVCPFSQTRKPVTINVSLVHTLVLCQEKVPVKMRNMHSYTQLPVHYIDFFS